MRMPLLLPATLAAAMLLPSCAGRMTGEGRAPGVAGLDALFSGGEMHPDAHWGVRVETMEGGVLYDHNGERGFVPASILKLVTTAAALDLLGPDYTFETTVEMTGTLRGDGTLEGDLVIVGSGDPSLGSWHLGPESTREAVFARWIEALRGAGVTAVEGRVLGDGRFFTPEYIHTGWNYGDLPHWYATGSSGLAMEENAWRCEIHPADSTGEPAGLVMNPDTSYFTVINRTTTLPPGAPSDAGVVNFLVEGNVFLLSRGVARGDGPVQARGAVWDGARYAAHLFREELLRAGIAVSGEALNILQLADPAAMDAPGGRVRLDGYTSPPLSLLCEVMNRESHNFYAEQILRTLGRVEAGEGSYGAGVSVVRSWMEGIGAPAMEGFNMRDGSGLAGGNILQPRHLTHVLRWAHTGAGTEAKRAFRQSLAAAAGSDWLRRRMAPIREGSNVEAKTGYIGPSRTIAGTITNSSGDMLAFAILANNHSAPIDGIDGAADATLIYLSHSTKEDFGL